MQPLQQYQVQTQPHKQEMTYIHPPSYTESNLSFANSNGYLEAPLHDSGFVSDASLPQLKSETRRGSDSGRSLGDSESVVTAVPTRRGPFKSQYDRDQTAETRKNGCCLRCRHQKIRVRFFRFQLPSFKSQVLHKSDQHSASQILPTPKASASPVRT